MHISVNLIFSSFQGVEYQILPEHGLCARALYDYQAGKSKEYS